MAPRKRADTPGDSSTEQRPAEWATRRSRVVWLVDHVAAGNKSELARKANVSHTAVQKVVAGGEPGGRLLAGQVPGVGVDRGWLLDGRGVPFPGADASGRGAWTAPVYLEPPVRGGPPPTRLLDLPGLLTRTQYWLEVGADQPITRHTPLGIRAGTLLLMEADRGRFPKFTALLGDLCVVKSPRADGPPAVLAAVTHFTGTVDEPPALLADTFDLGPVPDPLPVRVVVDVHPGTRARVVSVERVKPVEFRGRRRYQEFATWDYDPQRPAIRHADVLAVWTGMSYRPDGLGAE